MCSIRDAQRPPFLHHKGNRSKEEAVGGEYKLTNRSEKDDINEDYEWRNRERDLCFDSEEKGYTR